MPSWNDGETSTPSPLSDFDFDFEPDAPESIYDPDFAGIDAGPKRCQHWEGLHKYVAFEGTNIGGRFLGCGCQDKGVCDTVEWVDGEWPETLKKALVRLWQLYDEEKDKRMQEGLDLSERNYKLVLEKRELEKLVTSLQIQLGNALSLQGVATGIDYNLEMEKHLKKKAENQMDAVKEEKKKLEDKIKKISDICAGISL